MLYEDGGITVDTMSIEELEKTRSKSRASNSMAWKDFTTEMYRKTVLHRLCKHIELDFETTEQLHTYFNENDMQMKTEKVEVPDVFGGDIIDVE